MSQRAGAEWSRAAWRRHLPHLDDSVDPGRLVEEFGAATIPGLAHRSALAVPDRVALRIDGRHITHRRLDEDAGQVAGWLRERIAPGDRVLLAGPSSLNFVRCYLGALRAGAIVVLGNPAYTVAELAHLVRDAEVALAFAAAEPAARLHELTHPPVVVDLDGALSDPLSGPIWPADGTNPARTTPDDVALLAYTSGTTGRPKGVPLTHRHLLTSIRSAMAAWRWSTDDVLVHALPLFHQHGLSGVHATLVAGSSAALLSRFSPADLVSTVREVDASVLFAVPTMYERLVETGPPDTAEVLGRLRLFVCGSAPLSEALAERTARLLGRLPLVRYGTTETGLDVSNPYGPDARADTIGLPLPGVSVRVASEEHDEAPFGVDGEIQLRGPQVFTGYWRDDRATAEAFTADGWFRTGDIGMVDPDSGHLVIRGRSKELIITGGMNVYPREVEVALEQHPSVAEAAVAGLPHERWGEQVTGWVVLRPGYTLDTEALLEHARSLLAPYKCPKQIFQLDALPRNHMGKIARRELAAPEPSMAERAVGAVRAIRLADPAYDDAPGAAPEPMAGGISGFTAESALRRAQEVERLGAFVELYPDVPDARPGPLHGVPVAVKDFVDVAGQTVRGGTARLGHRVVESDSVVWAGLRDAGCVLIGRTRVPPLAWSVRTPGCANPWAPDRDSGGSSGGSAVAVAAGVVPIALGTDTGGSIRIPAALCGVAGLRPTAGTVSRRGVTALAPSMDTVGPIARTSRECLLAHAAMGGSVRPVPSGVAGLRVGWPGRLWTGRVDPAVERVVETAADTLRAAGAEIVEVDLPTARHARVAGYVTMLAESAALWWDAYRADPDGLAAETAELLAAGAEVSTADYVRACRIATAVRHEVDQVFGEVSALLLPTVPVTAALSTADSVPVAGRPEPVEAAYFRLTALASVTGHPALSVPAGLDGDGLPVGAQLIGPRHAEALLCLLGGVIENGPEARELAGARARLA